jgi:hypothetical protein
MSFGCIAGDVADLTRAGESDDHRVFFGSSCRSPLHGWIPMAADGSVDWRRFFACRIHQQAGLRWDSLRAPFAAKTLCLRPGAARRSPSARVSRLRLSFVVPAVTDVYLAQGQEHVGSNQQGRGGAALPVPVVFRHRQCCLLNRCELVLTSRLFSCGSAYLTLLAGDFVPGF